MAPVVWSPFGAAGIAVGIVAWLLAFLVYRTDPSRRLNQLLALLLFVEGSNLASGNAFGLAAQGPDAYAWTFVHAWMDGGVIVAYLLFIGRALDTPLVRPFRSRAGHWILGTLFAGFTVFLLANPTRFIVRPLPFPLTWYSEWTVQPGTIWPLLWLLMAVTSLFGLVSAIHAWRRARVGPGRRQALTYVLAFGTRDVGWFGVFLAFGVLGMENPWTFIAMIETHKAATLAYLLLLTYGFLKTQLLDIDLQIKRGIRGSTVTGAFAGAFFLASETIEQILPVDGTVYGVLAAAGVTLALRPVQGFAEQVANRALPGVEDTPAYRQQRRIELYQAALAEAVDPNGEIPPAETERLSRLRDRLDLTEEDHDVLLGLSADRSAEGTAEGPLEGRTVLDRYHVERRLGEGSQGQAYLAHDDEDEEAVVLKVLGTGSGAAQALEEVQALVDLDDPYVLGLRRVEEIDGRLTLVLDHAEQGTLADRLEDGPLDDDELHALAEGLLSGLEAVHEEGLVHRDVKPSNVFRMADGRWVVGDLGIAHRLADDATVATMTPHGQPGTARYMSPEQAKGQTLDHRSDLFSAGLVLSEAATGGPLIEASGTDSAIEMRMRVASWQGLDPAGAPPGPLADVLTRALARDPEDRFADAAEMRASIEATNVDGRIENSNPGSSSTGM